MLGAVRSRREPQRMWSTCCVDIVKTWFSQVLGNGGDPRENAGVSSGDAHGQPQWRYARHVLFNFQSSVVSLLAHHHVVGMLRFMSKTYTNPACPPLFLFCSCVCFYLYGPFNCILFHKFARHLIAFLLCFSGLFSALLVLSTIYLFMKVSTIYLFMKVSLSPDIISCGWLGSNHQLTNCVGFSNRNFKHKIMERMSWLSNGISGICSCVHDSFGLLACCYRCFVNKGESETKVLCKDWF